MAIVENNDSASIQYSILLPTYNESDNLPIIVWLLEKYMRFFCLFDLI